MIIVERDPFEVLGIPRTSSDAEIKAAYRNLVKEYHPDKHQGDAFGDVAEELMKEVNTAYCALKSNREAYSGGSPAYRATAYQAYTREEKYAPVAGSRHGAGPHIKSIAALLISICLAVFVPRLFYGEYLFGAFNLIGIIATVVIAAIIYNSIFSLIDDFWR